MIDFPLIDAHVHLWDTNFLNYPWLITREDLNRPFSEADYHQACGKIAVEKAVFIQSECDPLHHAKETAWATKLAQLPDSRIGGVVAFLPLEKGRALRYDMESLKAKNPLVKGIRRVIQYEPDLEFCLRPRFVQAVQMLSEFDWSFDIRIGAQQLEVALELVEQCPDTRFILNHMAKPDVQFGKLDPWRRQLTALSKHPNVSCKVSGLVSEADPDYWTEEDFKPFLEHVFTCFGFDRVLFASVWPICESNCDYARWVQILTTVLRGEPQDNKRKFFRDNALKSYRLK